MPYSTPTRSELLDLLKRLQGSGYTRDAGTARVVELEAVAEIASRAGESLAVASNNATPSSMDELASAYEYAHQLPSDDSLTDQERQARAVAFTQAVPHSTSERVRSSLFALTGSGSAELACAGNPNNAPRRAPRAYWRGLGVGTPQQFDAARLILERAQSASCVPPGAGQRMAWVTTFANSGDSAVLHTDVTMTLHTNANRPDTSAVEVTIGETVTMDLANEIRRLIYWHPTAGVGGTQFQVENSAALPSTRACGEWLVVLGSIANATTAVLDANDWGNQFASAYGIVSATNITTGGGVDVSGLASADRVFATVAKSATYRDLTTSSGTNFGVLLAFNNSGITLQNNSGVTRYFMLFIRGTARWTTSTTAHSASDAVARKASYPQLEATWMARNSSCRDGNATTNWTRTLVTGSATAYRGPHRRVIYTGPTAATGTANSSVPQSVVVDTSIDWRGRWVMAYGTVQGSASAITAANWDQMQVITAPGASKQIPVVFYTGAAGGSASAFYGALGDGVNATYRMYARASDGALVVDHASSGGGVYGCGLWMVVAAPKSSDSANQSPLDATYVAPVDLAEPQYNGVWQQGWPSEARYSSLLPAQTVPTNPPLGLIGDGGCPPVPLQWTQRERVGVMTDPSVVVRQRIFGQRKRMISVAVPAGSSRRLEAANGENGEPIDEIDYRDRVVWIAGNVETVDTTIGTGSATSDAAGASFMAVLYTGPYGTQTVTLGTGLTLVFSFGKTTSARAVHAEFSFVNANGSARYINATLECTGQLGLSDTRTFV